MNIWLIKRCRSGFTIPIETFEGININQNVSNGVANPVTLRVSQDLHSMNILNDGWLNQKVTFPPDKGEIIDWLNRPTIEFQFYAINQHLDFLKRSMKQETDNLKVAASQFVNEMGIDNDEIASSIYHSLLQDGYSPLRDETPLAINEFEQIQWRSNFIVLYSVFEHILNLLCYVVEKKSCLNTNLNKITGKGEGIHRAEEYLVDIAKVKIQKEQWDRVLLLCDIRNVLVHSNGELDGESKHPRHIKQVEHIEKHINKDIKLTNWIELNIIDNYIYNEKKRKILLSYEFIKQSVDELQKVVMDICNYPLYADKS